MQTEELYNIWFEDLLKQSLKAMQIMGKGSLCCETSLGSLQDHSHSTVPWFHVPGHIKGRPVSPCWSLTKLGDHMEAFLKWEVSPHLLGNLETSAMTIENWSQEVHGSGSRDHQLWVYPYQKSSFPAISHLDICGYATKIATLINMKVPPIFDQCHTHLCCIWRAMLCDVLHLCLHTSHEATHLSGITIWNTHDLSW